MSKVLALVVGTGSQQAVVKAAEKVLSAVGVSFVETAAASVSGVAVGSGLSAADVAALKAHSSVLNTDSAALSPDAIYADAKYLSIRAFTPNPEGFSVAPVDRVDKFAKAGISTEGERTLLKASFAKTAAAAVSAAQDTSATKITVLQKPQSAFKEHNALFLAAVKAAGEAATISVEVSSSQSVTNSAVMFSKSLGVVVSPDYAAGHNFDSISAGIAGGNALASRAYVSDAATVHSTAETGNPASLLVSAARALKQSGDAATAGKIEAAVQKAFAGKGWKASAADFAKAI